MSKNRLMSGGSVKVFLLFDNVFLIDEAELH